MWWRSIWSTSSRATSADRSPSDAGGARGFAVDRRAGTVAAPTVGGGIVGLEDRARACLRDHPQCGAREGVAAAAAATGTPALCAHCEEADSGNTKGQDADHLHRRQQAAAVAAVEARAGHAMCAARRSRGTSLPLADWHAAFPGLLLLRRGPAAEEDLLSVP